MIAISHRRSVRRAGLAASLPFLVAGMLLLALPACRSDKAAVKSVASIYRARATGRLAVNDTVGAGGLLYKAEQLDPKSSDTQILIGEVLRREGNLDEAAARYRRALELDPHSAEARLDLGLIHGQKGEFDQALAEFRAVAENTRFERRDLAYDNIGQVCLEKKDLDCAEKAFREAVLLNDQYARSQADLGRVLSLKGDDQAAAGHLETAVKLDPKLVEARYHLALAYIRIGRRADAIAELRNVIRLTPQGTYARDAREELTLLE